MGYHETDGDWRLQGAACEEWISGQMITPKSMDKKEGKHTKSTVFVHDNDSKNLHVCKDFLAENNCSTRPAVANLYHPLYVDFALIGCQISAQFFPINDQ